MIMMGFGFTGFLMMTIFWGGLIAIVVWANYQFNPNRTIPPVKSFDTPMRPQEILDQGYATGEIDRQQYETMKEDLGT